MSQVSCSLERISFMKTKPMKALKTIGLFSSLICLIFSLANSGQAFAYDNPELLPNKATPVIDLAKSFNKYQRETLEKSLNEYEDRTGWKIRVLTQFENTPGLAIKKFWDIDERTLLLVADPRGGNLLNFNVGDAYYALMPRLFWVELQTRFGNQFFVRDNGEDGSILGAVESVETCLDRGGCQVVPGLPREQRLWTLASSILGGVIAGFASSPRKKGELIAFKWLLLISPLWIILFGVFGLTPVITRTHEIIPVLRNTVAFIGSGVMSYLFAKLAFKENINTEED